MALNVATKKLEHNTFW